MKVFKDEETQTKFDEFINKLLDGDKSEMLLQEVFEKAENLNYEYNAEEMEAGFLMSAVEVFVLNQALEKLQSSTSNIMNQELTNTETKVLH